MSRAEKIEVLLCLFLFSAILILSATAPTEGNFWWSDAPRHALNGVFVKDFLSDWPIENPKEYAYQYYLKYPALTILFYPSIFYFISVPFYAVFGFSHAVAQSVVSLHYLVLAGGMYLFARHWLSSIPSFAATMVLISSPEVALWGRQVMLEIPALAFVIISAVALMRYRRRGGIWRLYVCAALLLCAVYIKLTALFLLPVFGMVLLRDHGWPIFQEKHSWIIAGLFLLGILPLTLIVLIFGQANIQSISGIEDSIVSRVSIDGWFWYLKQLPHQMGWIPPLLATTFLIGAGIRPAWRLPKDDFLLLVGWFIIGYLFFSAIDLKEARHTLFILPPVAVLGILTLMKSFSGKIGPILSVVLGVGTMLYTILNCPVPNVEGYARTAEFVAKMAPKNSVVLFSGQRDGSFVFNIRARDDRPDLTILRADKLLLSIAVRRELGVSQKNYSQEEIYNLLGQYGVQYVVAQSDFWIDLEQMARLQNVLRSDKFEEIATINTKANFNNEDSELRIYRNLGKVVKGPINLKLDLPIIGSTIEGVIGN